MPSFRRTASAAENPATLPTRTSGERSHRRALVLGEAPDIEVDGTTVPGCWIRAKADALLISRDTRFEIGAAGGGGYGNPAERSPTAVVEDLEDGYVSLASARDNYRVAVTEREHEGARPRFELDEDATRLLPGGRRVARGDGIVIRIGTDVGGTFTDFVAVGPDGNPSVWKVPSVPDAPARAVLDGLPDLLGASQIDPVDVAFFGHATTIATNSLLERKGANVALLTTAGCRDVLEIGRLARPDDKLYDLHYRPHPPLVPRRRRLEVLERVDATGAVVIPLDEHMVVAMADELRSAGVHAVAVAFLFSYLNPSHERRVREIFADRAPGLDISLSCEIAPNAGEYERTSSTVVNASVQTIMATYLDALSTDLSATGVVATLRIMQSNGGLSGLDGVLARPVATLLSGPCAGAIAGRHTAAVAGIGEAINLDMGGTSCDISLVIEGDIGLRDYQHIAGDVIRLPSVDLNTIGAGGGSVAWIDPAGSPPSRP